MRTESWDGRSIERVEAVLGPALVPGTEHRLMARLRTGGLLRADTEVVSSRSGEVVGALHVWDEPSSDGVVGAMVAIAPEHRGHGLGRGLAERAMDLMAVRYPARAPVLVLPEGTRGVRFAERFGFRVRSRSVGWEAPLDPTLTEPHDRALRSARLQGLLVRMVPDREVRSSVVDDILRRASSGLPHSGSREIDVDAAFASVFNPRSKVLIAELNGRAVGVSLVGTSDRTTDWYIDFTAVDPAARGRGVARHLKHAQFLVATRRGGTRLFTYNDENNVPILRLNDAFGMQQIPGYLWLDRRVESGHRDMSMDTLTRPNDE